MYYPHMFNAGYILTCTLSMWLLVMFSGDAYRTPSFSEHDVLDHGTGICLATAVDDKEVLVILCSMNSAISHFIGDKNI